MSIFSSDDYRRFGKVVVSTFYTKNRIIPELYRYLKRFHPNFDSPKLSKIYVFRKLFPGEEYSDIKLRNLFRELTRLAEEYLLQAELTQNVFLRRQLLIGIYGDKKLHKLFDQEVQKQEKALNHLPYRDMEYYQQYYQMNLQRMEMLPSKALLNRYQLLMETGDLLNHYFHLSEAKTNTELESFRGILSAQQTAENNSLRTNELETNLVFQLFQKIQQVYQTANLEIYAEVKTQLMGHIDEIRPSLQIELLTHLINFTIRQMKEDDERFNQLAFELYRFGLDHKILVQDGELHDTAFLNIAIIASKAGAFEWVEHFLSEYDQMVLSNVREDVKTLALANLNFHRGKFSQAIDDLNKHHFVHPLYVMSARLHHLRCSYELFLEEESYFELFIAQGQAFEKFVRRSKVHNDAFSKACLNFVGMIMRLANLRLGKRLSATERDAFYKKLEEQNHTISRSWLLQKIKE